MNTQNSFNTYSSSFEIAIAFVLGEEGGFVDDPADNGGATKYGISQRSYPDLNIQSLTIEQVKTIYHDDYWQKCRCGELPAAVACVVMDTAVNMGIGRAIRLLQEALRVTVDGIMGPKTIEAAYLNPPLFYLGDYFSYRARRYHTIVVRGQGSSRFIRGWFKRCFQLQQYLYEERLL
ncbi:hypothetical protein ACH42_08425 [Endozoicomonas sp. (ex Bugula neritina AB1)]|nr:hypothetical protein ACH42_08425 [Endozoicomonas sp. (ex Bugula neritina AB1)]